jgi:hypothetical protein
MSTTKDKLNNFENQVRGETPQPFFSFRRTLGDFHQGREPHMKNYDFSWKQNFPLKLHRQKGSKTRFRTPVLNILKNFVQFPVWWCLKKMVQKPALGRISRRNVFSLLGGP